MEVFTACCQSDYWHGVVALAQYLFSIVAYSILFIWTYNNAMPSVFIVTLMHGVTNAIASFVFRDLLASTTHNFGR
jgi:hypothetical protein